MPRSVFWTAALAAALLAGCQANAPVPVPPAVAPSTAADAASSVPLANAPAANAPAAEAPAADPNRGFSATDPASVQLAAGRPQLIEFYAEW